VVRLLLIALLLLPSSALAQTPSPFRREPPGEDVRVFLRQGETAPFPGILFDQDTALRWASYLEQALVLQELQRKEGERLLAAELTRVRELSALQLALREKQAAWYQARVSELEKKVLEPTPFYRTFWFGAAVGATLSLAGVATVYAISR